MTGLQIVLSPPEAVEAFRQIVQFAVELEGELSPGMRRRLEQKAGELGVHPVDTAVVLRETGAMPFCRRPTKRISGRLKMSVAYISLGTNGLELSVERELIFKVNRISSIIDDKGNPVRFDQVLKELEQGIRQGQVPLFREIVERFSQVLVKNPREADGIISRFRALIGWKIDDPQEDISEEDAARLQAFMGNLRESFPQGVEAVFLRRLHEWEEGLQSPDKWQRYAEKLFRSFFEWGGVIFGWAGLQRLSEVDLRMAVALQEILLPPNVRLGRIRLQEEIRRQREALKSSFHYKELQHQLRQERQRERKAILYAFQVKYEDGQPVVKQEDLDNEVTKLAAKIQERYVYLMLTTQATVMIPFNDEIVDGIWARTPKAPQKEALDLLTEPLIMAINRAMVAEIVEGILARPLEPSQKAVLDRFLTLDSTCTPISRDLVIHSLGVERTDANYDLVKAKSRMAVGSSQPWLV